MYKLRSVRCRRGRKDFRAKDRDGIRKTCDGKKKKLPSFERQLLIIVHGLSCVIYVKSRSRNGLCVRSRAEILHDFCHHRGYYLYAGVLQTVRNHFTCKNNRNITMVYKLQYATLKTLICL